MRFKTITIPPKGRNKYGNYSSAGNISRNIISYNNGGNSSTNDGGDNNTDDNEDKKVPKNYTIRLGHTTGNFEWDDILALNGQTNKIDVLAFADLENIPTFVGDITLDPSTNGSVKDRNYDITGIEKGMQVEVLNNGTSATTINLKITKDIDITKGTIYIPVSIYTGDDSLAPYSPSTDDNGNVVNDESDWYDVNEYCKTLWLEYNFLVIMNAVNNYTLEITNEIAAINCDVNGYFLADAVKPTCRAYLYFGENLIEGAKYGITYPNNQGVVGLSINTSTGELTFGNNFYFQGSNLEIVIYGTDKDITTSKIMSINKLYPGKDGSPAVNRWIVPSVDLVKFNPNNNTLSHNSITAKVMKQVGSEAPTEDTSTTLYYGWNTTNPITTYTGSISVVAGYDYLTLALKNDSGVIYEYETIPIIKEGKDGSNGSNGTDGESVYRLALSNENASINADSNGNIYSTAVRPSCTATLYYGASKASNVVYSISTTATGVTINSSTGVLTFASNFNFTGTTTEITIEAKIGSVVYGTAIMNVSKNIAGKDGTNGTNGTNGLSIVWKGELSSAPSSPQQNWCYRNTTDGKVYIYNGSSWQLMVLDGSDGEDGANGTNGADGKSVFITYHDNAVTSTPSTPTGNGTTNGWHTNATKAANWMSQKVAESATAGSWGAPIQICGQDGQNGTNGTNGKDGTNGADAVSYWLDLSTTEVIVAKGATTATPSSITIKAYKQVGGNAPTEITSSGVIKWGYNTSSPQNTSTTISNITTSYNYIMVHLVSGGTIYDRQTISILKDGKDGTNGTNGTNGTDGKDGAQGRQGAAIRGPIDWKSVTSSRRWCNGVLTNASYPEDAEFIDVVVFNGTYYKCKISYNGAGSETSSPSTSYWTQVDSSYAFVATNLLLANNAKIKFASSNEIYLMDNSGNVTAGAAGGNGVSFWAGANEPTNAKFKVDYDGNLYAKTGTFAGFVQYPYVRTSTLMSGNYCIPGNNAYLLVDSGFYGMGDGCKIKLPAPTAELNGFTYYIIAKSNIATKAFDGTYAPKKFGFNHSITLLTENAGRNICQNVFWADAAYMYTTLAFYSGTVVVTCTPSFEYGNTYMWCVTQCQDVDCYVDTTLTATYSSVISDNSVEKVYSVDTLPTTTRNNVIYFVK